MVFPKYRNKETRVSEQELRFAFIEAFNELNKENNWGLYYSVETPTEKNTDFLIKGIQNTFLKSVMMVEAASSIWLYLRKMAKK